MSNISKIAFAFSCMCLTGVSTMAQSLSLNDEHQKGHHHFSADLAHKLESKERDSWQRPEQVIALMGPLNGKRVIDIGAGTGYFSFRLVAAGAQVIAADANQQFIDILTHKQAQLGLSQKELEPRLVPYDSPNLAANEVDIALIVDTYHHIDNRVEYLKKVKLGLSENGQLIIIDYKKDSKIAGGPPLSIRLAPELIAKELRKVGFKNIELNNKLLEKQYIIHATR